MNKKLLLTLSILFLFTTQSFSGTILGADISYKHLSAKKYEVTFKFYRDCTGVNLGNLNYNLSSGSNSVVLGLTKKDIIDITPTCKTAISACSSAQSGLGLGTEIHIFKDTVDFNDSIYKSWIKNGACEFRFNYGVCCRNSEITTINTASFYTDAMLNLCNLDKTTIKHNSSPTLTIDPIAYLCCNNPYVFNNGALDTSDYDSLSYAFISPRSSVNVDITHKSPFSAQYPMTPKCIPPGPVNCRAVPEANPPLGTYINPINGDMVFTPTKCDEIGLVVVEIKEWRKDSSGKYVHIGTTQRDIQLSVRNCGSNWPPSVTSSKYDYTVCEGDEIVIDIDGKDHPHPSDPNGRNDTVSLFWNGGLEGKGTFEILDTTSRERKAKFTWKTEIGDAKDVPYTFVVQAKDDACPIVSITSKAYSIQVLAKPSSTKRTFTSSCDKLYVNTETNTLGILDYRWELYDSVSPNKIVGLATNQKDSIQVTKPSTYYVKLKLNNESNCTVEYWDTLTINPKISPLDLGPDRTIMYHDSAILDAVSGMNSYLWSDGSKNATLKLLGSSFQGKKEYSVITIDNIGCQWKDTIELDFNNCDANQIPTISIPKNNYSICTEETLTFLVKSTDTPPSQFPTGRYDSVSLYWVNPIPGASFSLLDSNSREKTGLFTFFRDQDSGLANYSPIFRVKDDGCSGDSASKTVVISPKTRAKGTFNNVETCGTFAMRFNLDPSYDLPASYAWEIKDETETNTLYTSSQIEPNFTITTKGKYIVSLTLDNSLGCITTFKDTVELSPYKNIDLLPTTASLFKHESIVLRPVKSQTYSWNNGSSADSLLMIGKDYDEGNERIILNTLGTDGCSYVDTMLVQVSCAPDRLDIGTDLTLDMWDSVTLSTTRPFKDYLWINKSTESSIQLHGHLLGLGQKKISLTATDSFQCTYTDELTITVAHLTTTKEILPDNLQVYPSPTKTIITIELPSGLQNASVVVYNVIGKVVLSKQWNKDVQNKATLDISKFPKGLYLVKVRKGEKEYTSKVVKE